MQLADGLGYRLADVEAELGPDRFREFREWLRGQTQPRSARGEALVWPHDYRRFLAGLRPLD